MYETRDTHIGSIISNELGNGTNIPDLSHRQYCAYPPDQESNKRSDAMRQFALLVPNCPIKPGFSAKDQMLFQRYSYPDGDPVTHERKEICEDFSKMISSSQRADSVDDYSDRVPDRTRNTSSIPTKDLEVDAR